MLKYFIFSKRGVILKIKSDNNVVLESFVFPTKHLPKCFSNYKLYTELDNILKEYKSVENIMEENFSIVGNLVKSFNGYTDSLYGSKKGTEPLSVYISKPNGANRVISVVNPLVLIPLHFYINKYHDKILVEQLDECSCYGSSSKFSFDEGEFVRSFDYDGDVIFGDYANVVQPNYQYNLLNKQKICDGKYYRLTVDINNFFNSIYTHTIAWDLTNTENKYIFDNLDAFNRFLNRNETKGIVIGPYTSSLFSEIILSKVDKRLVKFCQKNDISYVRFCDDFEFYSDSKEKLENDVRLLISEELSKYKLDLNMSKMKLEEFPFISLNTIQNKSIFFLLNRIKENDYSSSLEFIEDVMNEVNNAIRIKYSNCNYLLKILVSQMKKGNIPNELLDATTAEILLDFLVNMMFKQNMISTEVVNLIIEIFGIITLDKERIITKWIKKRDNRLSHIKEITDIWLLYIIVKLDVSNDLINKYTLEVMKSSDLCSILSIEYLVKNSLVDKCKEELREYLSNIKENLKFRFNSNWKKAGYYTKYWLLFYTNSIRWNLHKQDGFGDTILNEMNLEELFNDSDLKKQLNLFFILKKLNISFFEF